MWLSLRASSVNNLSSWACSLWRALDLDLSWAISSQKTASILLFFNFSSSWCLFLTAEVLLLNLLGVISHCTSLSDSFYWQVCGVVPGVLAGILPLCLLLGLSPSLPLGTGSSATSVDQLLHVLLPLLVLHLPGPALHLPGSPGQ